MAVPLCLIYYSLEFSFGLRFMCRIYLFRLLSWFFEYKCKNASVEIYIRYIFIKEGRKRRVNVFQMYSPIDLN